MEELGITTLGKIIEASATRWWSLPDRILEALDIDREVAGQYAGLRLSLGDIVWPADPEDNMNARRVQGALWCIRCLPDGIETNRLTVRLILRTAERVVRNTATPRLAVRERLAALQRFAAGEEYTPVDPEGGGHPPGDQPWPPSQHDPDWFLDRAEEVAQAATALGASEGAAWAMWSASASRKTAAVLGEQAALVAIGRGAPEAEEVMQQSTFARLLSDSEPISQANDIIEVCPPIVFGQSGKGWRL